MFYAQSTSTVISGRTEWVRLRESINGSISAETGKATDCSVRRINHFPRNSLGITDSSMRLPILHSLRSRPLRPAAPHPPSPKPPASPLTILSLVVTATTCSCKYSLQHNARLWQQEQKRMNRYIFTFTAAHSEDAFAAVATN